MLQLKLLEELVNNACLRFQPFRFLQLNLDSIHNVEKHRRFLQQCETYFGSRRFRVQISAILVTFDSLLINLLSHSFLISKMHIIVFTLWGY